MAITLLEEYRSIRGFYDILPPIVEKWLYLERILIDLMHSYGYNHIKLPLVEKTALFKRAIGEVTDIIEKELFSFKDEKNRNLSLRPEGTAGCVRAGLEHGLFRQNPQKLWYCGPMFRYEAPQKGRSRQFYQFGVECFGVKSSTAEIEQIAMIARLWRILGLTNVIILEINNLGSFDSRRLYTAELTKFFHKHYEHLDPDSQRRLQFNPLRILDSKNIQLQAILADAPKFIDYIDSDSLNEYKIFKAGLQNLNLSFRENHNIVRGLDYYTGNVWEWTTSLLGAQSAIGAGGRYDKLVEQLGGERTPAVGLALGLDRLMLLLEQAGQGTIPSLDLYLICSNEITIQQKLALGEKVRDLYPQIKLEVDILGGSFKSQFKRADRSGARLALILGDEEVKTSTVTIKYLWEKEPRQYRIRLEELQQFLT